MEAVEAIKLALDFATAKGARFTGVKLAVFMANKEWGLRELHIPGDHWFVYLHPDPSPEYVGLMDSIAVRVSCSTREVGFLG
jgi:hypothetical protein